MRHVKAIKEELLSQSKYEEALGAIDELLEFAPYNLEALKLKAQLLEAQGKYAEATRCWVKVLEIEPEDPQALDFSKRFYLEEEEKLFFSEELNNNNYIFFVYPKKLVRSSIVGFVGCMVFLFLVSKINMFYSFFADIQVMLISFVILVLLPWMFIIYSYFKSLNYILLNIIGIKLVTKSKSYFYKWDDIDTMGLFFHDLSEDIPSLDLIIIPKHQKMEVICIDFTYYRSSIRAKYHLVKIFEILGHKLINAPKNSINIKDRKILYF